MKKVIEFTELNEKVTVIAIVLHGGENNRKLLSEIERALDKVDVDTPKSEVVVTGGNLQPGGIVPISALLAGSEEERRLIIPIAWTGVRIKRHY